MQESRLFKLLYYLLEHGKSTAPELAEQFEVSVRTIYRDIDALSLSLIHISHGGLTVHRSYWKPVLPPDPDPSHPQTHLLQK